MRKKRFGVFLDCVGNGAMNIPRMKEFIDVIAQMGYNLLELGLDDMFVIEDEPYFGYLNGLYKKEEMQEIDRYAKSRDVEIVPSIQTLAHMGRTLSKPMYLDLQDLNEIMLVDDEKVDALIEKMFQAMRAYFSTDMINLGFDEAHFLGRGRYLDKHGYHDSFELMLKHLNKVVGLAEQYRFKVHIWADMFFKLATKNYDNDGVSSEKVTFSEKVKKLVPKGVGLCYWDYYSKEEKVYDAMFSALKQLDCETWFGGTVHTWWGYAPLNTYSMQVLKPAMRQVKKQDVNNVLITLWAHEGFECSYFSALPSLYAAKQYAEGNFDDEEIKRGFKKLIGVDFDDFMLLELVHKSAYNPELSCLDYADKALLHEDCFSGRRDYLLSQIERIPFGEYGKKIADAAERAGEYRYLFDNIATLAEALEAKAYLGIDTRKAYLAKDKAALETMLPRYALAAEKIEVFRNSYRKVWMRDNTPYGWKVHQSRLGGLQANVVDYAERIKEYLCGKCDALPELEDEILPYSVWASFMW